MRKDKSVPVWWMKLSEASFAVDWDNEEDAVYDNWRELYTTPKRDEKAARPS